MTLTVPDVVGAVGAVSIVFSYLMLMLGRLSARGRAYPLANALGASMILFSLVYDFNLAAALVEGFWLVVSLIGLVRVAAGD